MRGVVLMMYMGGGIEGAVMVGEAERISIEVREGRKKERV